MPEARQTLEGVSDDALARRIASAPSGTTASEEAELYRRFAPRVRLFGRRHLRDGAAAEDLAQDVLLRTIERLRAGEVERPESIGSFILGTSRMMVQGQRRTTRRREALMTQFADPSDGYSVAAPTTADHPRVAACVRALAERERMVVLLTFYADRDAPGIAADLGVSAGAVRVIRHRAMARLRDCVLGGTR